MKRLRIGITAFLLGSGGILGCSGKPSPTPPVPGHGIPTPLGLPASSVEPTGALPSDPLGLRRFTPLMAEPGLKKVADAVERGDSSAAAQELEAALASAPPSPEELPRWQYLLGKLREQAGEFPGAALSYDLAARADWPLKPYAELGVVRMLVRLGRHGESLEHLKRIPAALPIATETRLLIADVASEIGDGALAVSTWRSHLAGQNPSDVSSVRLRLSEALLKAAESKDVSVPTREEASKPVSNPGPGLGVASPSASAVPGTSVSVPLPFASAPLAGSASAAPSGGLPVPAAAPLFTDARQRSLATEALFLARRVRLENAGGGLATRGERLELRAIDLLPEKDRVAASQLSVEDQLVQVHGWVEARQFSQAIEGAERALAALPKPSQFAGLGCELGLERGRALAGNRAWSKAAQALADLVDRCKSEPIERRARMLYLAGSYHASDGRHMQAVRYYEMVEREAPHDRLADDARLKAAMSYFEQGVEARFTELLNRMPEDYPNGDMVQDGVFRLALRRMEKSDWSGAASVLDRAAALVGKRDSARGTEFSGRERYFRARAWMMTGERERGLTELESIVRELPLSYYMLHAYSRLLEADPFRAKKARDEGIKASENTPFAIQARPEFELPGFLRARELLRLGEMDYGRREIDALDLARRGTAPQILWGVALFYAQAGAAKLSHDIARGLLTDWLQHWPSGDWAAAWQLAFPRPFLATVERESKKNEIPEYLTYAIMREESSFDAQAVSPADAYGLMQLIPSTAKLYGKPVGLPWTSTALKTPTINIALGCRALGDLSRTFNSNPLLAIPSYNAGPGASRRWVKDRPQFDFDLWVELIPYRETLRYTKRVLAARAAYAFLYHRETADPVMALPVSVVPR